MHIYSVLPSIHLLVASTALIVDLYAFIAAIASIRRFFKIDQSTHRAQNVSLLISSSQALNSI